MITKQQHTAQIKDLQERALAYQKVQEYINEGANGYLLFGLIRLRLAILMEMVKMLG